MCIVRKPTDGSATLVKTKRTWNERDWDVLMEAQSFVAVYADATPADNAEDATETESKTTAKKLEKKATKNGNSKKPRKSTRKTKGKPAATEKEHKEEDEDAQVLAPATVEVVASDSFWLAQLQDDVTEDMIDTDASVRVTWLNKVLDTSSATHRYEVAYDEWIDVQAILCHVFLTETIGTTALELTAKSLARVEKSLRRTKGIATPEDDEDSEEETAPKRVTSQRRKSSSRRSNAIGGNDDGDDDGDDGTKRGSRSRVSRGSGGGGRRIVRAKAPTKMSKRIAAMHIPPQYATVSMAKYDDAELLGSQPFDECQGDVLSSTRAVIRAVRSHNYELLKFLLEDDKVSSFLYSFQAYQSVDVQKTAMQFAMEADDVKAVAMLLQARKSAHAKGSISVSLPCHSTGAHTSSYSDYNRRAINASRGGKEGNNALLEDANGKNNQAADDDEETKFVWSFPHTTPQMLTVLYPSGSWVTDNGNPGYVASIVRAGNYKLAYKLVEVLSKNGGWGYNDLHAKVLSPSDEELPNFRSVSVLKKAQTTKITPLHFAAINPNIKYLESLCDAMVADQSQSENLRDDAGFEPIHYAAVNESPAAALFLLEKKSANLLSRTKEKHTPLMHALLSRREETAIAMLEWIASSESEELCAQVVSSRGPLSYHLLHFAADQNCLRVVEHLLVKMGVEVNVLAASQTTALSLAARRGHYECVELLLAHGAKIDRADKLKKTPLLYAVKNGHTRLAVLLINSGANVNAYDTSENSIVHYAASYGWLSSLKLLQDAGADLWARNSWGFVPLICAMLKQRMLCVEYLLQSDTESRFLDFRDRSGCTMLLLQCQHSNTLAQITYLLEKGLNPNIGNTDNVKPLDVLIQRSQTGSFGFGRSRGGAVLPTSASVFYLQAIQALVKHGAQVNYTRTAQQEEDNERVLDQPLQIAIRSNQKEIFDFLLTQASADPLLAEASGNDAWLTSAAMGGEGTYYLRKLLAMVDPLSPWTMRKPRYNSGNIFHLIAQSASSDMVESDVVKKLLRLCSKDGEDPNAITELMHEKNSAGLTPFMVMLGAERARVVTSSSVRDATAIAKAKQQDGEFCKIVRLFGSGVSDPEALKKYVSVRVKQPLVTPADGGEEEQQEIWVSVLDETIFHLVAQRTLRRGNSSSAWYGEELMALVLGICPISKPLVDVPTRTSHETPLLLAVANDDPAMARLCLENGANVNYSPVRCSDKDCQASERQCESVCAAQGLVDTALVRAIRKGGQHTFVTLLLDAGASTQCYEAGTRNTPLHMAMKSGKVALTKQLLAHGASMESRNDAQSTPFFVAVASGKSVTTQNPHEGEIAYCRESFGRGQKPAVTAASLRRMEAAQTGSRATPFTFSSGGATPGGFGTGSGTVVDVAVSHESFLAVIGLGDQYDRSPLHHAALKRDLPLLSALLDRIVDTGEKVKYVNGRDVYGRTALHFALNTVSMKPDASFDIERFLLLSGADVHVADTFGLTPLHYAMGKINMDWHHQYDATLDSQERADQKASGVYDAIKAEAFAKYLHGAASNTQADPVETLSNLLAAGCDPMACDALGRLPMHLAASAGGFVCVSTLLSACAPSQRLHMMEQADIDGFTPLGRAFQNARETTITTLIQSGASVSNTMKLLGVERSYFSIAVEKGMSGICHMLLNAGFSRRQAVEDAVCGVQLQLAKNLMVGLEISSDRGLLGSVNSRQETLLHCLAKHNSGFAEQGLAAELAWALVDQGVSVQARDQDGNSVLHHAASQGNTQLMDFLLHHGGDVNAVNNAGDTPLMHALKRKSQNRHVMLQYLLTRPGLQLGLTDARGLDTVALFIEHFLTDFETDEHLHQWLELACQLHGDVNLLYTTKMVSEKSELFGNGKVGVVMGDHVPLLIRVSYAKTLATRMQLLALLLKQGASPATVDTRGNTVVMHLVARNMMSEVALVLQHHKKDDGLLNMVNQNGFTALHLAVEPFTFGSYENVKMIELLVKNGANMDMEDSKGESVGDYASRQASRVVWKLLQSLRRRATATQVDDQDMEEPEGEEEEEEEEWQNEQPQFEVDAKAYLDECDAMGKITKTRKSPEVNENCDVGDLCSVYGLVDGDSGKVIEGEEYDTLLTKVDVKNGRFGVNVFYSTQVVFDELQSIYIVFTNWGRIGEEGKFQNTPFHSSVDAVNEFKKIFKSKTSNNWEDRHPGQFEKKRGKYNLVRRVNYSTHIDHDVTQSFAEQRQIEKAEQKKCKTQTVSQFAPLEGKHDLLNDPSVLNALFAITDVRNLQLAASNQCNYYEKLPLARDDELRVAMAKLQQIKDLLVDRKQVQSELDKVSGNLAMATEPATTGSTSTLLDLSEQFTVRTEQLSEQSSQYYEIVPCYENYKGSAIGPFEDTKQVDKELYKLTLLLEITHTYKMLLGAKKRQREIHPMAYIHDAMQIQFSRLQPPPPATASSPAAPTAREAGGGEHGLLEKYFFNGIRPSERRRYKISNVFQVSRKGETQRFTKCLASDSAFTVDPHTKLLWHGTRCTNLMGILSEGLRIAPREAPHNGAMYGRGLYFSDVAAKSLGYCDYPYKIEEEVEEEEAVDGEPAATGATTMAKTKTKTITRQVQYMLLCEVALGTQRDVQAHREPKDGDHSVRAVGQHMPDESESLVSPVCGVKVPVGRVGRPGTDFVCGVAWATKSIVHLSRGGYDDTNTKYSLTAWTMDAESYLNNLLATNTPYARQQRFEVESETHKKLFIRKGYYNNSIEDGMKVEIVVTQLGSTAASSASSSVASWDVTVEIVVTPPPQEANGSTTAAPKSGGFQVPAAAPTGSLFGGFGASPAPAPSAFGGFGASPAPAPSAFGGFGASPAPAPSAFGGFGASPAPATSAFGAPPASAFGGPSASAFGALPAAASSFGGFGAAPAAAPSGFGFGGFGVTPGTVPVAPSAPAFGSGFGSSTPAPATTSFGAGSATGFHFGGSSSGSAPTTTPAATTPFPYVVAKARRYQQVLFSKPPVLEQGYTLHKPDSAGQYNEHVVYSPDQARIRYLVEVELVNQGQHNRF